MSSSSLPQSPRAACTILDAQIAYGLDFGRSSYARKAKKITFPMALVSCQGDHRWISLFFFDSPLWIACVYFFDLKIIMHLAILKPWIHSTLVFVSPWLHWSITFRLYGSSIPPQIPPYFSLLPSMDHFGGVSLVLDHKTLDLQVIVSININRNSSKWCRYVLKSLTCI